MPEAHVRLLTADDVASAVAAGESFPPRLPPHDVIFYRPGQSLGAWLHDEAVARCCSVATVITSCIVWCRTNTIWPIGQSEGAHGA